MKLFECQVCRQALYFENVACDRCERRLGYVVPGKRLVAFDPDRFEATLFRITGEAGPAYRFCSNAQYDVCNWVIPADSGERFCAACRHNHVIPDLSRPENQKHWRMMEFAKHRLFYSLIELDLPLVTRDEDPKEGLMFEFLEDTLANKRVVTGHINGKITINIAEADDAERERRRSVLREPYRTLLGHFRHEIGHWYWDRMVRDAPALDAFRIVFGDERSSYRTALRQHYAAGAPIDWSRRSVSAYATSHPWEDFAETFAHYLHIVDALDTANEFGIGIHPRHLADAGALSMDIDFAPQNAVSITALVEAWLPLTFAVNSLNRSMGQTDFYPFVLTPLVIDKLGFVHDLVHRRVGTVPLPHAPLAPDANLPIDNAPTDHGPFAEHPSR